MLSINQKRTSELLCELIGLYHATGPKIESMDESRFNLSHGCCYEVREAISLVLQKESIPHKTAQHAWHAWLIVDGVSFDTLCPAGYSTLVAGHWRIAEIGRFHYNFTHDDSHYVVDSYGPTRDSSDKVEEMYWTRYWRLQAALEVFCGRYGIATESVPKLFNQNRKLKKFRNRLTKALKQGFDNEISLHPLLPPTAYFSDSIEIDQTRPLEPYPYRLTLTYWQSRLKDLRKRGTPIWQM